MADVGRGASNEQLARKPPTLCVHVRNGLPVTLFWLAGVDKSNVASGFGRTCLASMDEPAEGSFSHDSECLLRDNNDDDLDLSAMSRRQWMDQDHRHLAHPPH